MSHRSVLASACPIPPYYALALALLILPSIASAQCATAHLHYPNNAVCSDLFALQPDTLSPALGSFLIPPGLSVDTASGDIIVAGSIPATYTLQYIAADTCHDTASFQITIHPAPDAAFTYPNPVCLIGPDPQPTTITTQGGTFSLYPSTATINPATGLISLSTAAPGTYIITYTVSQTFPSSLTCTSSELKPVLISQPAPSAFYYPDSAACASGTLSPVLMGLGGGQWYSIPAGLSLNTTTGQINLAASDTGTYTISYTSPGLCQSTDTFRLTVHEPANALFSYTPASFCIGAGTDPTPNILADSGGTFHVVHGPATIDSLTGRIYLAQSQPSDSIIIRYKVSASGTNKTRPSSAGRSLSAAEMQRVGPSFGVSSGASTAATLSSSTSERITHPSSAGRSLSAAEMQRVGPSFGVSSGASTAATLSSSTSEQKTRSSSEAETHGTGETLSLRQGRTPTTLLSAATCSDSMDFLIRITAPDTGITLTYDNAQYCQSYTDPYPQLSGTTGTGGSYAATPPGLAFVSPFTGQVDLSASQPGTYLIRYYPQGTCTDSTAGHYLTILPTDRLAFTFPAQSCSADSTAQPTGLSDTLGTFQEPSGALAFTDPNRGIINLTQSTPGVYAIHYTSGGNCKADTTLSFALYPSPNPEILTSSTENTFCEGDSIHFLAFGGDRYEWRVNGTIVQPLQPMATYIPDFPLQDGDLVSLTAQNVNGGCTAQDQVVVSMVGTPRLTLLDHPTTVAGAEPVAVVVLAGQDSTHIWWMKQDANGQTTQGVSKLLTQGEAFILTDSTALGERPPSAETTAPALARYHLVPKVGACAADTVRTVITRLPEESPFLIPSLITPNGDGHNDTWQFLLRDGLNPDDYTITLLSRTGGTVWKSNTLRNPWQPTAPDGVYYWSLTRNTDNKTLHKGGLTIRSR